MKFELEVSAQLILVALKLYIRVDLSFRQRNLTFLLAWISSTLLHILASIDQVF